jgi:hypothetical protein
MRGNRFRDLLGDGPPMTGEGWAPPNVFAIMEPARIDGFVAADNLYCLAPGGDELFAVGATPVDFDEWRQMTMVDATSSVEAGDDPACTSW